MSARNKYSHPTDEERENNTVLAILKGMGAQHDPATKDEYRRRLEVKADLKKKREASTGGLPAYITKQSTSAQIKNLIKHLRARGKTIRQYHPDAPIDAYDEVVNLFEPEDRDSVRDELDDAYDRVHGYKFILNSNWNSEEFGGLSFETWYTLLKDSIEDEMSGVPVGKRKPLPPLSPSSIPLTATRSRVKRGRDDGCDNEPVLTQRRRLLPPNTVSVLAKAGVLANASINAGFKLVSSVYNFFSNNTASLRTDSDVTIRQEQSPLPPVPQPSLSQDRPQIPWDYTPPAAVPPPVAQPPLCYQPICNTMMSPYIDPSNPYMNGYPGHPAFVYNASATAMPGQFPAGAMPAYPM